MYFTSVDAAWRCEATRGTPEKDACATVNLKTGKQFSRRFGSCLRSRKRAGKWWFIIRIATYVIGPTSTGSLSLSFSLFLSLSLLYTHALFAIYIFYSTIIAPSLMHQYFFSIYCLSRRGCVVAQQLDGRINLTYRFYLSAKQHYSGRS